MTELEYFVFRIHFHVYEVSVYYLITRDLETCFEYNFPFVVSMTTLSFNLWTHCSQMCGCRCSNRFYFLRKLKYLYQVTFPCSYRHLPEYQMHCMLFGPFVQSDMIYLKVFSLLQEMWKNILCLCSKVTQFQLRWEK